MAGHARERLSADGFSDAEIERIFGAVPVATHNQRGLGTLHVGCPEGCDVDPRARLTTTAGDVRAHASPSDEGATVAWPPHRPCRPTKPLAVKW